MHPAGPANPHRLDYEAAPSAARRVLRGAFRLFLVTGLLVAGYIWGPPLWQRSRMLYWQRQCMNFTMSADSLVYDDVTNPGRYAGPPACWTEFVDSAAHVGPALSGMPQYGSMVFLGRLKTPSGEPQLVAIAFTSSLNWWAHGRLYPGMSYQVWVVKPGSLFDPPTAIAQVLGPNLTLDSISTPAAPRFYFGQHNPSDPSRFTVRYQAWGQEDVVDGRIDDAGQVTLKQRKPPTQ